MGSCLGCLERTVMMVELGTEITQKDARKKILKVRGRTFKEKILSAEFGQV